MEHPPLRSDNGTDPTRRKSTLFCWECGHTSPIEAEWVLDTHGDYVQQVCPDCNTVLSERPRTDHTPALRRRTGDHPVTAWGHFAQASVEFWRMPFTILEKSVPRTDQRNCS